MKKRKMLFKMIRPSVFLSVQQPLYSYFHSES